MTAEIGLVLICRHNHRLFAKTQSRTLKIQFHVEPPLTKNDANLCQKTRIEMFLVIILVPVLTQVIIIVPDLLGRILIIE